MLYHERDIFISFKPLRIKNINNIALRGYYVFVGRGVVFVNVDVIEYTISLVFYIKWHPRELYYISWWCLNSPDTFFVIAIFSVFKWRLDHTVWFLQQSTTSLIKTIILMLTLLFLKAHVLRQKFHCFVRRMNLLHSRRLYQIYNKQASLVSKSLKVLLTTIDGCIVRFETSTIDAVIGGKLYIHEIMRRIVRSIWHVFFIAA